MPVPTGHAGHSAQVKMRLMVNGLSLPVTQLGPDFLLVEGPVDHPPTSARVILKVDETERSWTVRLPSGLSAHTNRVTIMASV